MPVIDRSALTRRTGSGYPAPYDRMMEGRSSYRLGDAGGLTQFGANLVMLEPGALSSLRHWHMHEDEFVMVTEGTLTLIDDAGAHPMGPGDCAAFPAGDANGHHFRNDGDAPAAFLVIGTRALREEAFYSDIDMRVVSEGGALKFTRKDGSPLPQDESETDNG